MAAKGTQSKEMIMTVLRKEFPNAFMNGKEFRIPCTENGEEIQIKITLTAAKDCVPHGGGTEAATLNWSTGMENEIPWQQNTINSTPNPKIDVAIEPVKMAEPTQEEKDNLAKLLSSMF